MKHFWISPTGNDDNPGTQEHPFLTPEKARDAVRSQLKSEPQSADIVVWFEDGLYRLARPFTLSSQDSGQNGYNVVYKAAEGAMPQICGSIPVTGWEMFDPGKDIYRANVGPRISSRQLYVNGRRATRARTNDYPEGFIPIYSQGGICYELSIWNDGNWRDPSQWQNLGNVEAVLETQWKMMRVPLQSLTKLSGATGKIVLQNPAWDNANLYLQQGANKPGIWSFWRITRFENALAFLTDCGEWYLDESAGYVYYKPHPHENLTGGKVQVELPVLQALIDAAGSAAQPLTHVQFEELTFSYATWLEPSGSNGYVADQSGFLVVGTGHEPNITGHVKKVVKTPGNIRLKYAHHTVFRNNTFSHLGCVGLDYGTGSKNNIAAGNTFTDISSAAIQLGDVTTFEQPVPDTDHVSHNTITQNRIQYAAVEYVDAAGIFAGFTEHTTISYNTISDVHWSGIAMGWGWGLLDPDGYPGIPGAEWFEWGKKNHHTINRHNKILYNQIQRFLQTAWDGGAIYTTGYQGTGVDDALLVEGNVAMNKTPQNGGNVFYTDGGSRWIILLKNSSIHNPIGKTNFGPAPKDPSVFISFGELLELAFEDFLSVIQKIIPYGGDIGGCRTYGDIEFIGNKGITAVFYDICPYQYEGVSYPANLVFDRNDQTAVSTNYGGASYPPMNPVTSWHVPRVSLPGILGLQKDYLSEWWYYGGVIYNDRDQPFSVLFNMIRVGVGVSQAAVAIAGIGWRENGQSYSLHALGAGIGVSQQGPNSVLNSLVVAPVSDDTYQLNFEPVIEFTRAHHSFFHPGIHINTTGDNWSIGYTGGNILGAVNATYSASLQGVGYIAAADSAETERSDYRLQLTFADGKGMVMENQAGVVSNTYECAMPVLEVQAGGQLTLNGQTHRIARGSLWMDRQMMSGVLGGSNVPLNDKTDLLKWFSSNRSSFKKALYTGNWLGITLQNGLSLVLVEFWTPHPDQWISGTRIGSSICNPRQGGFGNLYLSGKTAGHDANGGQFLRPRLSLSQDDREWDYDINLLNPESGGIHSPHWKSPQTGITYCTAWQIGFSPALNFPDLPQNLFLFVLSDNSEIIMSAGDAYYEGAAFIYETSDRSHDPIGQAFVEQMGYN